MNSSILSAIGLGNFDPAIIFIVMLVLLIVAFILIIIQWRKISKLEDEIVGLFHDNRMIRSENEKNRKDIIDINKRLNNSFQKIGLEKYDAFSQGGGKLSFALCMLDEKDNGFLLNSVHNSDGMNYSYSKEITSGVADVELCKDERRALEKALESTKR